MLAVPVSLIGTFAGLSLLGYSINTLTLFGMVLAIGIVVDDAIVVLENVERIMREGKAAPREAAIKAMQRGHRPDHRDRAGAVRGVRAGRVPRRPHRRAVPPVRGHDLDRGRDLGHRRADAHAGAVRAAAQARTASRRALLRRVQPLVRARHRPLHGRRGLADPPRRSSALLLFAGMVAITVVPVADHPGSLVPDEDQGFYIAAVILPDGATLERTDKVVRRGRGGDPRRTRRTRTSSRSPASTSSAAASATTPRRSSSR